MAQVVDQEKRRWFRRRKPDGEKQLLISPGAHDVLSALFPVPLFSMFGSQVQEAASGAYGVLYRSQPAVRTVVDFLAKNISQIGIKTYRRRTSFPEVLRDHQAQIVLQRPGNLWSYSQLLYATVAAFATYENAFWWLVREGDQRKIFFLPPENVTVKGSPVMGPSGYVFHQSNSPADDRNLSPDEVVHFKTWNPYDARIGVSRLEGLRSVLADDALAARSRAAAWANTAFIPNVIERPPGEEWNDDDRERFRTGWQQGFGGPGKTGKTPVLEDGMTINWGPDRRPWDTEYIAGREATLQEVVRSFHIPLSMLGLMSNANYKATSEEHKVLYADVLGAQLNMLKETLEVQFLPWFDDIQGVYFEFNLKEKLRGSFAEEAAILTQAVGGPWMLRAEARSIQDLPFVAGTDELITPLNVTVGGQPNPLTPTATPAGPLFGASLEASKRKALPTGDTVRKAATREHQAVLEKFFARQAKVLLSRLGAKAGDVFDAERWNKELYLDLLPLAFRTAKAAGKATAQRHRGSYDEALTVHYLEANTRLAAEGVNVATAQEIDAAEDPEALKSTLTAGLAARAVQIAATRATNLTSFGTHEAARQNDLRSKTWVVTSGNSRHPEMGGESVALGEAFSNGGQYPGDVALPTDQSAGCLCLLDVG